MKRLLGFLFCVSITAIGGWSTTISAATRCVQVLPYSSLSLTGGESYSTNDGIETPVAVSSPGTRGSGSLISGQTSTSSATGRWLTVLTGFLSESMITMTDIDSGSVYTVPAYLNPASGSSTNASWCTSGICVYQDSSGTTNHSKCTQETNHNAVSVSGTLLLSAVPPGRYSLLIPVNLLVLQAVWASSETEYNITDVLNAAANNYKSYATQQTVSVEFNIPVHCSFGASVNIDLGALTPAMSKVGSSQVSYICTAPTSAIASLTAGTKPNNSDKSTTGVTIGLGNSHDAVISVNGWGLSDENNQATVDLNTSGTLTVAATATPVFGSSNITTGKVEGNAILTVTHD